MLTIRFLFRIPRKVLRSLVTAAKIESEKGGLGMEVKKTRTIVVSKQEGDTIKADSDQ